MRKLVVVAASVCLINAGCATSSKDIAAVYVSPLTYKGYDCDQIQAETQRVQARVMSLGGRLDQAASNDAGITAVGIILFWPALFFLGGTKQQEAEYAQLKGQYDALEQAAIDKKCSFAVQRPPPPTTTAAGQAPAVVPQPNAQAPAQAVAAAASPQPADPVPPPTTPIAPPTPSSIPAPAPLAVAATTPAPTVATTSPPVSAPAPITPPSPPAGTTPVAASMPPPADAPVAPPVAARSPARAQTPSQPSKWSYSAEQLAKSAGCVQPMATMNYNAPGVEGFTVTCGQNEPLVVRCDVGQCRALK